MRRKAFTLVEVLIVVIVIGILSGTVLVTMGPARERAEYARFQQDKSSSENAALFFDADNPDEAPELRDLVDGHYLEGIPRCIAEGTCAWSSEDRELSWLGEGELAVEVPLTEWGNDFEGISTGLIDLIAAYDKPETEEVEYPRSWGDYAYEDLGLDPELWGDPINGVIYKPVGSRVQFRPAEGVVFHFNYASFDGGRVEDLAHRDNYNIVYDMKTGKWYYHHIPTSEDPADSDGRGQEIDITTLEITR